MARTRGTCWCTRRLSCKKNGFFLKKCLRNSINYPWPLRGGGGGVGGGGGGVGGGGGGGWSVSEALQYFKSSPV